MPIWKVAMCALFLLPMAVSRRASTAQQDDGGNLLRKLIPRETFRAAGLHKLTETELEKLALWIAANFTWREMTGVKVIAPSVSTSMEARKILARTGTSEVPLRHATTALVVVRSSLFNPLRYSYRSYRELERDADGCLNISGPKFHVYLYSLDDELKPMQQKHTSYPADSW